MQHSQNNVHEHRTLKKLNHTIHKYTATLLFCFLWRQTGTSPTRGVLWDIVKDRIVNLYRQLFYRFQWKKAHREIYRRKND